MRHWIFFWWKNQALHFFWRNNEALYFLLLQQHWQDYSSWYFFRKNKKPCYFFDISFEKLWSASLCLWKKADFFEEVVRHFIFLWRNNEVLDFLLKHKRKVSACFFSEETMMHSIFIWRNNEAHRLISRVIPLILLLHKKINCLIIWWAA